MQRPHRSPQRRLRSLLLLAASLLGFALGLGLATPMAAQQATNDFEPLNPFESGSSLLGLTDSAPMVRYNEFTGNVTVSLDAGVPGLRVPISYARERQGQLQRYGVAEPPVSGLGNSWHLGYGFVQAKRPYSEDPLARTCDPQNQLVCSHGVGWAAVVEANGAVTDFHRDSLFQSLPDPTRPVTDEAHFLDSSLRRLTRDRSLPFTHGPYTLLSPDGTRTTYEPVYVIPAGDPQLHMRFYPTEIEGPDGRVTTLTYGGDPLGSPWTGGPADFHRPLLAVADSWNRELRFVYYSAAELQAQLGVGAGPAHLAVPRLKEIRAAHSVDEALLASFEYTLARAGGDSVVTLARHTTAEGYATDFHYGAYPGHDEGVPLLQRVDLRTGGSVEMTYQVFTQLECQPSGFTGDGKINQNPLLRLASLDHSGDVYHYTYTQHTSGTLDGTVKIDVSTTSGRYSRRTDYISTRVRELAGGVDCQLTAAELAKPRLRLTGQPTRREETYVDRDGVASTRVEEWTYQAALLNSNDAVALKRDESDLYAVVPVRYSRKFDGECADGSGGFTPTDVWIDTDFTYDLWPGSSADNLWQTGHSSMASGDFLRPVSITRSVRTAAGTAGDAITQSFDYLHRIVAGHSQDATLADFEHAIGLGTLAEAWYLPAAGADQPLARLETDFDTSSEVRTLPSAQRAFRSAGEFIETRWEYYDLLEPWAGLLRRERRGPAADATGHDVAEYSFGTPSRIVPVEGPETTRVVHWDGTVTTETEAGVQRDFSYDLDRRLVRTDRGFDWSEFQDHSPPGAPAYTETWRGFSSSDQNGYAREDLDVWGRSVAARTVIDQAPYVEATTATAFNPIGLLEETVGPAGARVETRFDVFGRQVETQTFAADGSELAHVSRDQIRRCDGTTFTRTTRRTSASSSEADVTTVVTDLAGRTVRAGTNEDAYLASLDPTGGGFTDVLHGVQHLDGTLRRVVTLAPYGQSQRTTWSDWQGRPVREDHPETGTVLHSYDGHGRKVLTQHAGGRTEQWTYDRAGRVIEHTSCPAAGPCKVVASYGYSLDNGQLQSASTDDQLFVSVDFDATSQRPVRRTVEVPVLGSGPLGLSPSGDTPAGELQLSWSPEPGARFYQVQALQNGQQVWKANRLSTAAATLPAGVWTGDGTLTWRVRSFDVDYAPSLWTEAEIYQVAGVSSQLRLVEGPSLGSGLDFGTVEVGQWADRTVTLANDGSAQATGSVLGVSAPFSVPAGGSYDLAPGQSQTVTLRFEPTSVGASSAQAEFTSADSHSVFLSLAGTGDENLGGGSLSVSPASLSFPATEVDQTADLSFTATNGGTERAIGSVTGLASPFQVIAGGTFDLAPGAQSTVTVRFAPTAGGTFTDSAEIAASGADPGTVSVSGTASDPGAPFVVVDQNGLPVSILDFGQVDLGSSRSLYLELIPQGSDPLFVDRSIDAPFVTTFNDDTLTPGTPYPLNVVFTASAAGTFSGDLRFTGGGTTVTVAMVAEAADTDVLTLDKDTGVFPSVTVTQQTEFLITLGNQTSQHQNVLTRTEGDMTSLWLEPIFGLPEGAYRNFNLQLMPQRVGLNTGRVCFIAEASGQEDCITLSVTALPALSAAPALVDLGAVATGRRASGTLTLSKSIDAQVAGEMVLTPPFQSGGGTLVPFTLASGGAQSQPLTVDLAPTAAGTWSGAATITAERGEYLTVPLTGRSVDPALDGDTFLGFGDVALGQGAGSRTLTVTNPTEVPVRARLVLAGTEADAFAVPTEVEIAPFQSAAVSVAFTPWAEGIAEATLELRHAPPATEDLGLDQELLRVSLTGRGVDEALKRPWSGEVYRTFRDPSTGHHVAQLTRGGGDHLALFAQDEAFSPSGRWVVYRHLAYASASTLTYRRLEIETGDDVALTATGLANQANVHGDQLYVLARDAVTDGYSQVRRLSITSPPADGLGDLLLQVPGTLQGPVAVNADGSAFLYLAVDPAETDDTQNLSLRVHRLGDPVDGSLDTVLAAGGTRAGHRLRAVQAHPTDPGRFLLRTDEMGLAAVRLGRLDVASGSGAVAPLAAYDGRFDAHTVLGDALFGADGAVHASLAQASAPSNDPDLLVRLEASFAPADLGLVTSSDAAVLGVADWQHALRAGRAAGFFAGGGASAAYGGHGEAFVQLLRTAYDGDGATDDAVERILLAGSLGADQQASGSRHVNARLLPTLDAVLFAAPWDADTGTATDPALGKNLFLVRLPASVRALLRDDAVLGGAEGPFRHGVRAVASSAGWSVDHGGPAGFGDGVADQQAPLPSALPGATHFALADLDGDGVSERISMRTEGAIGWRVRATLSREDGVFATGAPEVERVWEMDTTRAPLFGDVDGDGLADLVVVDTDGVVGSLRWRAYRNTSANLPLLAEATRIRHGYLGDPALDQHVFVADVDGDGLADRTVARPHNGVWRWLVDHSTPGAWGDNVIDTGKLGGDVTIDTPHLADVNGDGFADALLSRRQTSTLRWFASLSSATSLGGTWDWNGYFGDAAGQALVAPLGRFATRD